MMTQKVVSIIKFSLLFAMVNLILTNISNAAEFEIDEIITAIKNEIKTANISELEFAIEKSKDSGIRFTVIELNDLKTRNINTH